MYEYIGYISTGTIRCIIPILLEFAVGGGILWIVPDVTEKLLNAQYVC